MKETSKAYRVLSERVAGLGRLLQTCCSPRINDVQGFGWDNKPKFHALPDGIGVWVNTRIRVTYRADQHKSDCE